MQSSLRLLVAMSTQSSSNTKELCETFNFSVKSLPTLFKITKKKNDQQLQNQSRGSNNKSFSSEDIRTLYIKFLLGFLMFGDSNVKKVILETKDAISGIFKGMWDDDYELVEFVFSVITKKVIDDEILSRSVKATFFNNYVLELITKLYGRNDTSNLANLSPDGSQTVSDLVHAFLLHLCTKPGTGICFQDSCWFQNKSRRGDSEKPSNKLRNTVLLRWSGFLRPTENSLELDILLILFKNCPELLQP